MGTDVVRGKNVNTTLEIVYFRQRKLLRDVLVSKLVLEWTKLLRSVMWSVCELWSRSIEAWDEKNVKSLFLCNGAQSSHSTTTCWIKQYFNDEPVQSFNLIKNSYSVVQNGSSTIGVHRLSPGFALLSRFPPFSREGAGTNEQQHQGAHQRDQKSYASSQRLVSLPLFWPRLRYWTPSERRSHIIFIHIWATVHSRSDSRAGHSIDFLGAERKCQNQPHVVFLHEKRILLRIGLIKFAIYRLALFRPLYASSGTI